jgi:hypothetical protein
LSLLNIKSEDAYERFITSLKNNNVLTEFEQQELKTKFEKLSEEELLQFVVDVLSKRIRPLMQGRINAFIVEQHIEAIKEACRSRTNATRFSMGVKLQKMRFIIPNL